MNNNNEFVIGIGRSLLNFPKSVPMAGYSVAGCCSEGILNDLTATCFNISNQYYIVTVDLMAISCLLVQSVVEKCNSLGYKNINRNNLIVSAIHNHTAMGGFHDNDFYNAYSSNKCGFIKQVFDFLVDNITEAIIKSCNNLTRCTQVKHVTGKLNNIQINRSFKKEPYNDVDILSFVGDYGVIAHLVYLSVHPTINGMNCKYLSSDFFGVARDLLEIGDVKTGFINVALGDQAPFLKTFSENGYDEGIESCELLGASLAHQISDLISSNDYINLQTSDIGVKYRCCDILNAEFTDVNGNILTTENDPHIGFSTLIGSEEAQVPIAKKLGFIELNGTHLNDWKNETDKKPEMLNWFLHPALQKPCRFLRHLITNVQRIWTGYDISNIPHEFCVFNYWIGSFRVYTSPFELTSGAVEEITSHLQDNENKNKNIDNNHRIIMTSITDTYLSYLCNSSDYDLQSYEGASTLYGRNSCQYLLNVYQNMDIDTRWFRKTYNKNRYGEGDHLIGNEIYNNKINDKN